MKEKEIVPSDSRYIPFTQQARCCVPTCIQMVMYKNNIPLRPAEEIGSGLGLIVPPEEAYLFYNAETSAVKPPAGYGTRIYQSEFEPNKAFEKLNIPLSLTVHKISDVNSAKELIELLAQTEEENGDALLCFNHGSLVDDTSRDWGHVCVFDRVIDGDLRIIDPSPTHPKWRNVPAEKMFQAMKKHGEKPTAAGIWKLNVQGKTSDKKFNG